jgi:hypothetical protein
MSEPTLEERIANTEAVCGRQGGYSALALYVTPCRTYAVTLRDSGHTHYPYTVRLHDQLVPLRARERWVAGTPASALDLFAAACARANRLAREKALQPAIA